MARTKDNRFQNLTIDYQKLMNLNVSRRFQLLDTVEGRSLLSSSNFTPVELSDLFPYSPGTDNRYNRKLQSLTTGGWQNRQTDDKGEKLGTGLKRDLGGGNSNPAVQQKIAALSSEQKAAYDDLKKGKISIDDPRVAFLKDIPVDDLKKAGIEKITDESGKQSFKMSEIDPSQSEIEVARKNLITGKTNKEVIQRAFADELRKKGVPEENVPYAVAALSGQVQAESGFNPTAKHDYERSIGDYTGYGIYGARDPKPGQGRKTDMFKWLDANGYDRNSAEGQARYMVTEAFSGKFPKSASALRNANRDNIGAVTADLVNEFERPLERTQNIIGRTASSRNEVANAYAATRSYNFGTEATDDQVREAIIARTRGQQEQQLATILEGRRTSEPSVSVVSARERNPNLYIAGDSIGQGVASASRANSLAVSGKRFTDPTMLDQLRNVPRGATVQIYGGTNDAAGGIIDPKLYAEQMARIKKMADENGFNVSIHGPARSSKRWDSNSEQIDAIMRQSAQESGLTYRSNRSFTADEADGVHFSSRAYGRLAQHNVISTPTVEEVPSMPDGGDMNVDSDSLNVYQLDKNKLRRDNMIAFDDQGKPAFTMNSKEEMRFDPNTGNVEVNSGSKGYKNNPNEIGPEPQKSPEVIVQQNNVPEQTQPVNPVMPTYTNSGEGYNSLDASVNATEKVFKSPSFERAVARARFQNAGDNALGGNFDFGAANMV
jgi:hypothetical protein